MLQKIYSSLLYHFIDNIKKYVFLGQVFLKRKKDSIDETEKNTTKRSLTEDEIEQMRKETWERICVRIREKYGKDAI